jgi:hypothetical protein
VSERPVGGLEYRFGAAPIIVKVDVVREGMGSFPTESNEAATAMRGRAANGRRRTTPASCSFAR